MAPVTGRVQVSKIQPGLPVLRDRRDSAGDFARYEGFAAPGSFMVEENAVRSVETICLAVVDRNPIGIELCRCIRTARPKWRGLPLGCFLDEPVKLRGRGLVESGPPRKS